MTVALIASVLTGSMLTQGGKAAAGTTGGPYGVYVSVGSAEDEMPINGLGSPSHVAGANNQTVGATAVNATDTFGVATVTTTATTFAVPPQVQVFSVSTNAAVGTIRGLAPVGFAMDPVNPNLAYALSPRTLPSGGVVYSLYSLTIGPGNVAAPPQLLDAAPAGTSCSSIAITPTGTQVVVGCNGLIEAIPLAGGTPTTWNVPGYNPVAVAVSPDGFMVYAAATDDGPGGFFGFSLASGSPASWSPTLVTEVGNVDCMAMSRDGTTVYIGGDNGFGARSSIEPFSTATGAALLQSPVALPPNPNDNDLLTGLALSPDGSTLLAAGERTSPSGAIAADLVYSIRTSDLAVVNSSPSLGTSAQLGPQDIAVTPDQAPGANLAPASGTAGVPLALDATASNVRYGSITRYSWLFGDGSSQVTAGPTVTHTYASAGNYTATVTETDSAGTSVAPAPYTAGAAVNGPGSTPYLAAASTAAISAPVVIGRPGAPPPPVPTTLPPHAGTTTTTTVKPPTAVPPGFHPVLTLRPSVGTPGAIVMASGHGFPPNKSVTVAWTTKTGSFVETTDAHGDLPAHELDLLTPDVLGPRYALAGITGSPLPAAVASFLVVPNTAEPGGGDRLLFRSEGP